VPLLPLLPTNRAANADRVTASDINGLATALNALLNLYDGNGYGFLANVPPGYTHTMTLAAAKAAASRDAVTPRVDIALRIMGGSSDAEWTSPWYLQGWDEWVWQPGVVRRGALCAVSTVSSTVAHPPVVIPAGTTDGDQAFLFLQFGSGTTGTWTPATIPGWTFVLTSVSFVSGSYNILNVYTRTMAATDAGTTLTPPAPSGISSQRLATSIAVYGGVSAVVSPQARAETVAGPTHATPVLTAPPLGAIWLTYAGERATSPSTAYTPPPGTGLLQSAYGGVIGGSHMVALADSGSSYYPAGSFGGGVWTGTVSSGTQNTVSIGLVPTAA